MSPNDSAAAVSAVHYEHDPSFFRAFLDPYMKYGSGYFATDDDTFEQAAVTMLDRSIAAAALPADGNVLDVGSGWGCLLRRLAETRPAVSYHHVNPSARQRAFLEDGPGRIEATFPTTVGEAELPRGRYDGIFLNDSLCHVGDRLPVLRKLREALASGGRIVVQDTFFLTEHLYEMHRDARPTRFVQEEIFGFAEIPSLEEFVREVADAGLRVAVAEDVSTHYLRTVSAWQQRLQGLSTRDFPLRDRFIRYLRVGMAGLHYTTAHFFLVLAARDSSRARIRSNLALVPRAGT